VAAHLIALAGVAAFMILLCIGILQDRYRRRRRQMLQIPRNEMPILRSTDLSKAHLKLILNEIVNSKNSRIDPPIDIEHSLRQNIDLMAGENINFKLNVLRSIEILEKAGS
jgi:hypothetical protein